MSKLIIAIIIMAVVTYLIRVTPLVLMKKQIESPFIQSFLYYIPYTVLAAMTFPAIIYSTGNTLIGMIGAVVAMALAFMEKSLLKTSLLTVVIVYVLQIFIK